MSHSRRDFLVRSTCAALGAAAFQGTVRQFGLANLLAADAASCSGGYKALVCILLGGGNDGNNMVIPYDTANYNLYSAARPGLAISQASLTPMTNPPSMGGRQFAFHPNMSALTNLFNTNKLAVVTNVGPLVDFMSQAEYMANSVPKPFSLFSHSDQVQCWETARPDIKVSSGWGGRTADVMAACNGTSTFPTLTSIAGATTFCIGLAQRPLSIGTGALNTVLVLNGFSGSATANARLASMNEVRDIDLIASKMIAGAAGITAQGVDVSSQLNIPDPVITTFFPNTDIANQLKQVAKLIMVNQGTPGLGMTRQVFFVNQGGYDTHQNQLADQGNNLLELSEAMDAFYAATRDDIQLENSITTFTLSDFARTLQPSGSGTSIGSDHGWGNHQFVMGGAVIGKDFYGNDNPLTGSKFPKLVLGAEDDTTSSGRGRWIPRTPVEEYGVGLVKWLGVT
ncbi:MAG: DUF1501 domain-containing protein, partial [Acidobacteriota bacterium]